MIPPLDPELLLREHAWLRRLARSLAADPHAADDLVQDTWVAALEHPPRALADGARAWLVAVARNLARADGRRRARASARERSVARGEALPSVSESVERVAAQRELVDAVLALEPLERDLVVLRYFEDQPPRAIAERLGLSGPAVRSRLSRALARLRERLDQRFEGGRATWAALLVPGGGELQPTTSATSLPFWLAALGTGAATLVVTVRALAPSSVPEASAAPLLAAAEPAPAPAGLEPSAKQEPPPVAPSSAQRVAAERAPSAPSAAPVASALTLVARFVDENGAPLAGVRLAHSTRGDEWPGESEESDAAGELRIELSWPYHTERTVDRQWAWLKASGRALATRTWSVGLEGPGEQSLGEIRMAPGGSIVGRTVDEDGSAVGGAFVTPSGGYALETDAGLDEARTLGTNLRPLFGSDGRVHARTGADGRFELDGVPATDVAVHAVAAGFLGGFSALTPLAPGATVDVGEVVLARPGPENLITGTVREAQGKPIAKVRIQYRECDPGRSEVSWHGAADDSGRFALQVPRERKYTLLFSRDENGQDLALADVPAGTLDLDVRLSGERWIEIVALDEQQEIAPILQLWANGVGLSATSEAQPDGRQRLRVPSVPFKIQIATPGYKNQEQGPFDPATVPDRLVFPVQRSAGMSGRVLADGVPVAGARVHAHWHFGENCGICAGFRTRLVPSRAETRTDAEGRFRIPGDSSGTMTLHAELDGWARAELGSFEFVDGVEETGLDLVLQRGGTIEGRLLVAEGVEARGKFVGVGCGEAHVATQELGADGTYRFEHLRPGEYQVLSVHPDSLGQLQRGNYPLADPADPVVWNATVRAGEVTHFDIDERDRIPSRLTGELRFDGQASAGWLCSLHYRHSDGDKDSLAMGRFDLRVPRPGPFSLTLYGTAGPAEVRLHQTLELAPGDNSWYRDLPTATLTLEHVPAFERTSSNHAEAPAYCLRWRDDPELTWTASLHEPPASDARLTIPLVPAGHVQVLRRPEDASYGPDESWPVVLELDLAAGAHARAAFP